ncbi:hypothetical protein HPB48_021643 [Haemaphysalis longicornis]|uniref:PiggyBac transposable element-derived protein domain-containing protein n=1 Tax=Haemaphysalis longicornis TaxID=44386 RepID=A0A9J6FBT6_HAELO|nr:hypothetical protein HPB48_021643 [Haemaphysalis longicornis]
MGAYVGYTNIPFQTVRAMEADYFFGPKKFCRHREALEELDNAEEADNDVDLVIVLPEPAAETVEEEGDDGCIEDHGVNDVCDHILYVNNFFTGIDLLATLRMKGFRATGTIRKNRLKNASLPAKKEMEKGDWGYFASCFDT